jgi:regulator of sirC expression with transglutaminase-like and TPR domain
MVVEGSRRYVFGVDPADRFVDLIGTVAAETHLDLLAALLGASFDRTADVGAVLRELDELAESLRLVADRRGVAPDFAAVMTFLFADGKFTGNVTDYADPRNSFIHEVLRRRVGLPITLSIVAMEVGRRVGVPVIGVGLPGHFFVGERATETYADPFHAGVLLNRDDLELRWKRLTNSPGTIARAMLLPTPTRSIMLRMLNNLKNTLTQRDDTVKLAVLAKLRSGYPELADERAEHARWMRHFN